MVKIYKQPFAHEGDTIAIPDASQPDGKMSNSDGWTPDYQLLKTDPNYKPVGRQEMNGVFKEVTEALGEIQQFGFAKWQPITWPQGARVVENDVVYRALNQTSQQPPHADWVADMDELVKLTGNQTIAGVKTFSSFPVTPSAAPTEEYQATNKKYVDDTSALTLAAAFGGANQGFTDNGYQILPGGLIFQWGLVSVPADSSSNVTFPIAFPISCVGAFAQQQLGSGGGGFVIPGWSVRHVTATGLTVFNDQGTQSFYWFAIGY